MQSRNLLDDPGQRVPVLLAGHVLPAAGEHLPRLSGRVLLTGQRVNLRGMPDWQFYGREQELELQSVRAWQVFLRERERVPVLRGGQVQGDRGLLRMLQLDRLRLYPVCTRELLNHAGPGWLV